MTVCHIALGGNIGDVAESFGRALRTLAESERISVVQSSHIYSTKPIGKLAGDEFSNAAAEIETDLDPLEFFDVLQSIEDRCGRMRDGRWRPRTLDLDLIFYGDHVIDEPLLRVPHVAAWYRRFVLDPLADICPEFIHPERGVSIRELRERLLQRPLRCCLTGGVPDERRNILDRLIDQNSAVEFHACDGPFSSVCSNATLTIWLGRSENTAHQVSFDDLPAHNRLDASETNTDRVEFIHSVIQSAIG